MGCDGQLDYEGWSAMGNLIMRDVVGLTIWLQGLDGTDYWIKKDWLGQIMHVIMSDGFGWII